MSCHMVEGTGAISAGCYTIITIEANEAIHVHDRMPVMLGFEDAGRKILLSP